MKREPEDDTLLRSYLLGELREEEADRLEQRLLQEDELFDLAEAVEADLLAAVDGGGLAPAERERVLRRLASSPQGRERLTLARSLNAEAARKAVVVPFRPSVRPSAIYWTALAACLLMLPILGWVALHNGPKAPINQLHVAGPTPTPASPKSHVPTPTPPANPPIATTPKTAPVEPRQPPHPTADVLTLTLMSLRGADEEVAKLRLSPGSHTAELQIDVEGVDANSFDVAIHREEKMIWEWKKLKPIKMSGSPVLVVDLPAASLPAGRYGIAITPKGESEEIQEFEVVQTNR
jgi:hypothetical protein